MCKVLEMLNYEKLSLPTENAEQLFRKHPVQEMRQYERLISVHLETHKQDVRTTIGERYPDLLQAASSIDAMYEAGVKARDAITKAEERSRLLALEKPTTAKAPEQLEEIEARQAVYQIASQLKLLVDTPELVWHCLENHQYLEAVRVYQRANLMYRRLMQSSAPTTLLEKKPVKVALLFPILPRQWETIAHLKQQIDDRARHELAMQDLSINSACACLAAISYLDKASCSNLLQVFLKVRSDALKAVASREDGTWNHLVQALNLWIETLRLHDELANTNVFDEFQVNSSGAQGALAARQTNSRTLLVYKNLPPQIQEYQLPQLSCSIQSQTCSAWMEEHQEWLLERLRSLLAKLKLEGKALYEAFTLLSEWEAADSVQRAPLMESVLLPSFKEAVDNAIKAAFGSHVKDCIKLVETLDASKFVIGKSLWSELGALPFALEEAQAYDSKAASSVQAGSLESVLTTQANEFLQFFEKRFTEIQSSYSAFFALSPSKFDVANLIARHAQNALESFQLSFERLAATVDDTRYGTLLSHLAFLIANVSQAPYLVCSGPAQRLIAAFSDDSSRQNAENVSTLTNLLLRRRSYAESTSGPPADGGGWYSEHTLRWLEIGARALSRWITEQTKHTLSLIDEYLAKGAYRMEGLASGFESFQDLERLPVRSSFAIVNALRDLSLRLDESAGPFISAQMVGALRQSVSAELTTLIQGLERRLPASSDLRLQVLFDFIMLCKVFSCEVGLELLEPIANRGQEKGTSEGLSFFQKMLELAELFISRTVLLYGNLVLASSFGDLNAFGKSGTSTLPNGFSLTSVAAHPKSASIVPMTSKAPRLSLLPIAMPNLQV